MQFFLYDTIKIMVLLGMLILLISYIQSYFPPERTRKFLADFMVLGQSIIAGFAWYCDTVLLLFIHSTVYWFYKCRTAFRCDIFLSDFFPMVDLGFACPV